MGLFNKGTQAISERQKLEGRYASARSNLLWVILFTAINIVLLVTDSGTYFLFSAFIPYIIVDFGMALCGKYPPEYYEPGFQPVDSSVLTSCVVVAAVICILYLLCWLFSKKRVGWMIVALVLFSLDTVLMLCNIVLLFMDGNGISSILDVVFHAWVIISLSTGIVAHNKLKKLPPEEETSVELPQE